MEIFIVAGIVLYLWTRMLFPKQTKPKSAEESLGKDLKQLISEAVREAKK
jgi:hypothetical protein